MNHRTFYTVGLPSSKCLLTLLIITLLPKDLTNISCKLIFLILPLKYISDNTNRMSRIKIVTFYHNYKCK